ncbi:MAG: L-lactate permease, partial [Actinomycetia bacterium]|nr:L-lactate permease [Actinomycetes bacterium]
MTAVTSSTGIAAGQGVIAIVTWAPCRHPQTGTSMDNLFIAALLALAPIIVAGVLLLGFRIPAAIAMPISLVVAAAVAFFAWQIDFVTIGASIVQGILVAIGLLWIVF